MLWPQSMEEQILSNDFFGNYFAWLRVTLAIVLTLPFFGTAGALSFIKLPPEYSWLPATLMLISVLLSAWVWRLLIPPLRRWKVAAESQSTTLERAISKLSPFQISAGIIVATACSLLLELALIRWQASLFELFAFYKNFMLLASFAGLGIGYACSSKRMIYPLFLPLSAIAITSMVFLRYGLPDLTQVAFHSLPAMEQLAMSPNITSSLVHMLSIYVLLTATFCTTALLFLPLGQLCGRLMGRLPNLRAYSLNLIGSLLGVLTMIVLSQMWTPPVVWFGLAFALSLPFLVSSRKALLHSGILSLLSLAVLAVAVPFGFETIYSPYQLIARGKGEVGLTIRIIAAGQYYQRIVDLSPTAQADPKLKQAAFYYDLPYRFKPAPESVLVVGAGCGNDVAAALRAGAKHVDAVEIDPAIYRLGQEFHPEQPYQNNKVTATIDDARQFLRKTKNKYDLIVFGLLDSHVATSQGSQLRTDSYIYTLEAFEDVRKHLKDDGVVALSFSSVSPGLDRKMRAMIQKVFTSEPQSLRTTYDGSFTLLQSKNGSLTVPDSLGAFEKAGYFTVDPPSTGGLDKIDLSTDDWPFFYMSHKQFPVAYVAMLALIVGLTAVMLFTFQAAKIERTSGGLAFMFLGAGFMLIETKAITELGLFFGNTWQLTGIVIAAIMIMAFAANLVIERFRPKNVSIVGICLLLSLGLGMYLHQTGMISADGAGPLIAIIVVTLPLLFSGILFSILLSKSNNLGAAMSMNLFGAMLGGAMEYMALWLGYQALYVLALVIYGMALFFCMTIKSEQNSPA